MGSSGSGKFGNYRVGNGKSAGGSDAGIGGGIGGGVGGEIECPSIIENIRLEDVAASEYYVKNQSLPPSGDHVNLHTSIYKGRLVVKTASTGENIGNLPTQYNYLINCIKRGLNYTGVVVASGGKPIPFVVVTLNA